MKRLLKIAIYSGEIPSTTFIERLIRGVSDSGVKVLLFGALHKSPTYGPGVKVVGYKHTHLSKFWHLVRFSVLLRLFKQSDKKRLDSYLKQQKRTDLYTKVKCYPVLYYQPDVFHIQWAKGLGDWMWVQEFGIQLVLSLRGAHINYSPIADIDLANMYRQYFPQVDGFHAVSEAIGMEAEKYGAPKDKITVVYSGLPMDLEKTITKKDHKTFQIISIGRPHWVKGYVYALDACKILKEQGFVFHYTIVGGANDIEYAYQLYDLQLTDSVTLLDQLPYSQVQELIGEADLLVLSSVKEGIANVILEAISLKTLVLSTDCGGITEVIKDQENGFIVPNRETKAMAKKIIEIANLPKGTKEQIREKALQTIQEGHTEADLVAGMLAFYEGVKRET